ESLWWLVDIANARLPASGRVNMRREFVEIWRRGVRAAAYPLVFGSIVFLGLTLAAHAKDKNECTQESLKGSYGFVLQGLQFPSPPSPVGAVPVSAAGVMVFNGDGSLAA